MIAIGKSISHLKASINYVLERDGAEILDKNIVSENAVGVVQEFRLFQQVNSTCHKNVLSFVISPDPPDGRKLSNDDLREITKRFLEKMKLEDHQYIAVVHTDKAHKHIHLYVNRIGYNSPKAYDDHQVGIRAGKVAKTISQEMGLTIAKERQAIKQREKEVHNPEMRKIRDLARAILQDRSVNSTAKFVDSFNVAGSASGLRAEMYHNNKGGFQGLRFYAGENKFKASEIDRSLSKQNIERHFEKMAPVMKQVKPIEIKSTSIGSGIIGGLGSLLDVASHTPASSSVSVKDQDKKKEKEKEEELKRGYSR